ncbi:hypothetical protein DFH06DRAFT_1252842 [Mycena polygramma]|nr:hypothetical protein DFH06DRAFT_1252842 [Mycena polygramma]
MMVFSFSRCISFGYLLFFPFFSPSFSFSPLPCSSSPSASPSSAASPDAPPPSSSPSALELCVSIIGAGTGADADAGASAASTGCAAGWGSSPCVFIPAPHQPHPCLRLHRGHPINRHLRPRRHHRRHYRRLRLRDTAVGVNSIERRGSRGGDALALRRRGVPAVEGGGGARGCRYQMCHVRDGVRR